MTNEQTYLLLMWIADSLEDEIDDLRVQLPEDAEREPEWWKGDRRLTVWEAVAGDLKANGFGQRPTGDFAALAGLVDFLEELKGRARTLLYENSHFDL